jgi:hypothetical protein
MERKKFFGKVGFGVLGILFTGFSALKLFSKNRNALQNIKVKINPLAVKRKNAGEKNV